MPVFFRDTGGGQVRIYLNVQELDTQQTYTLSWNMEYTGNYYLWALADFDTLTNLQK